MDVEKNSYSFCEYLVKKVISNDERLEKRKIIKETLKPLIIKKDEFVTISHLDKLLSPKVLQLLFDLYDKYFYDNQLKKSIKLNGCSISICANNRCISTAGMCKWGGKAKNKCFTIELSSKVFKKAFEKTGIKKNGGIDCSNILDCLMLTFEHELLHSILMCFCPDWASDKKFIWGDGNKYNSMPYKKGPSKWTGISNPKSGHSSTFMSILNNMFGHTTYTHGLIDSGGPQLNKSDVDNLLKLLRFKDIIKVPLQKKQKHKKELEDSGLIFTAFKGNKIIASNYVNVNGTGLFYEFLIPPSVIISINDIPVKDYLERYVPMLTKSSSPTPMPLPKPKPKYHSIYEIISVLNNGNNITFNTDSLKNDWKKKSLNGGIKVIKINRKNIKAITYYETPDKKIIPLYWNIPIQAILTINGKTIDNLLNPFGTPSPKKPSPKKPKKKKFNVKRSVRLAGIIDKFGKKHKSKKIHAGECIFPFKYKSKKYEECISGDKGSWCPTIKLKPSGCIDTWGYCI